MRRLLVLPLLLIALASACGDDDEPVDAGAGADPAGASLDGRTFVGGEGLDLVAGTELQVSFREGQLGLQAGCNQMSGGYSVDGDTLTVEPLAGTEMGCEPDRMDQDTRIAALFAEPVTFGLDEATLTLTFADGTIVTLTDDEVATPDAALAGPTWTLTTIIDGAGPDGTASSVPGGVVATVTFGSDGTLTFETGCNGGSASYVDDGGAITLTDFAVTVAGCTDAPGETETAVLAVLGDVGQPFTAVVDGRGLTLTSADGTKGLGFTSDAAPDQAPGGDAAPSTPTTGVPTIGLAGPTWALTTIDGTPVPDGIIATLAFTPDGAVDVVDGCNSGGGPYTEAGDTITFGPIAMTRRGCRGDENTVARAVSALTEPEGTTATWAVADDGLTLTSADGTRTLLFTAG